MAYCYCISLTASNYEPKGHILSRLKSFLQYVVGRGSTRGRASELLKADGIGRLHAEIETLKLATDRLSSDRRHIEQDLYALNDSYQVSLQKIEQMSRDMALLEGYADGGIQIIFSVLKKSKAQLRQDIFALAENKFKKGGFFVEFGACDGVYLSNTFLLEDEFGWSGILAEPARVWHEALAENRHCCIEKRCVWRVSGETIRFNEVDEGGLSTIDEFSSEDSHRENRKAGQIYEVESISLMDMLDQYNAPRQIDYLSIDTEGSEFDILDAFDFNKYRFNVITCEHNFTSRRNEIQELLERNGYTRKYESLSLFDDWYINTK